MILLWGLERPSVRPLRSQTGSIDGELVAGFDCHNVS